MLYWCWFASFPPRHIFNPRHTHFLFFHLMLLGLHWTPPKKSHPLLSPAELTVSVYFSLQESYRLVLPHVKNTTLSFTAAAYLFYWLSNPKQYSFFSCFMRKLKREKSETWSLNHFLFFLHSLCSLLFNPSVNEITPSFHLLFILDLLCEWFFPLLIVFSCFCQSWSMNSWPKLRTTDKLRVIN